MKIAIDLNDVIRDYTMNFARVYHEYYNHEYDFDDFSAWTNDMSILFPFKNRTAFERFVFEDYAYDLYGKCPVSYPKLIEDISVWINRVIPNMDLNEPVDIIIVSPMEYSVTVPSTLAFISKLGADIRDVYLPKNSLDVWNRCDVIITANPTFLENKPEGKTCVKINMPYNKECPCDMTFDSIKDIITNEDNFKRILNGNR